MYPKHSAAVREPRSSTALFSRCYCRLQLLEMSIFVCWICCMVCSSLTLSMWASRQVLGTKMIPGFPCTACLGGARRATLLSWVLLGYCRSILMLWSSLKHLLLLSRISASLRRLFSRRDQGCSHWVPQCTRQNITNWAEIASLLGRQA